LLAVCCLLQAQGSFVTGEVPAGLINGFNAKFTTAMVPNPLSSLAVYRNGLRQRQCPTCDYRVTTTTTGTGTGTSVQAVIVFNACCVPSPGDYLLVDYRF